MEGSNTSEGATPGRMGVGAQNPTGQFIHVDAPFDLTTHFPHHVDILNIGLCTV